MTGPARREPAPAAPAPPAPTPPAPTPAEHIPASGRVLGFDLGTKRVGVAVSDSDQRLATSLTTLPRLGRRDQEHRAMGALAAEYGAVGLVFGMPWTLAGTAGPAAAAVLAELEALRRVVTLPVATVDERLSTVTATGALRAAGRRGRHQREVVDQVAAAVLLQSWLDHRAAQRATRRADPAAGSLAGSGDGESGA